MKAATRRPLGYCAQQVDSPNTGVREQNLLSLSYGNIVRKDIAGNDGLLPESFETYNVVERGDTVLRLTDLQNDQRSLRVGFVEERGIITSAYVTLRPNNDVDPRFFSYVLKSMDFRKDFYALGAGVRQSLKFDELKRVQVLLPGFATQRAIADYLDTETARIDALIAKKQRLHDLIIARFASFREGLYRNDLADNGSVCLRHLVRCLDGARIPLNTEERSTRQGAYPYWGAGNIVDYVDDYLFDEELVLLGEDGAPFFDRTRDVAFHICERVWVNNHIHVLRCSASVHAEWLTHMLNAVDYGAYISGSTRDKLTQEQLLEIRVPLLSMDSQMSRLDALNAARSKEDEITSRLANQIELLRERRQALITAAVTGALDVPRVAA